MPDPYQLWIPFKTNRMQPDPTLQGELHQNWLELENWANNLQLNLGGDLPFIVVANDGSSADFTSIKDAVDSVASGGAAFIWIKYTGTDYSDTGPVAFGTKEITLWGAGSSWSGGAFVRWNITGSPDCSISSGANLLWRNIYMVSLTASTFAGGSTGYNMELDGCYIEQEFASNYGALKARQSSISIASAVAYFDFIDCDLSFVSGTYSLRGSFISECRISMGSGTCTFNNPGTSTGEWGIFNNNVFNGGNYVFSGWSEIEFVGNTTAGEVTFGPTPSGAITVVFESCRNIHYASNLWASTVTFSATGANNRGNISGSAYQMEIAGDGFSFNVMLEGDRGLGVAAATNGLLISGDHNVGTIFGNYYTNILNITGDSNNVSMNGTNVGTNYVNVSGDDNKIIVPGEVLTLGIPAYDGAPAVAFVDTGARNTFV